MWWSTPCTPWSVSRKGPADNHPAFITALVMIRLMTLAHTLGIAQALENPTSSGLWKWPPLMRLLRRMRALHIQFPMCAYGACYRKNTTVATTLPELAHLARRCTCTVPHEVLQGLVWWKGEWKWKTSLAGAYPPALAREVARCLCAAAPQNAWSDVASRRCYASRWEHSLAAASGHEAPSVRHVEGLPRQWSCEWHGATHFRLVDDSRLRRQQALRKASRKAAGPQRADKSAGQSTFASSSAEHHCDASDPLALRQAHRRVPEKQPQISDVLLTPDAALDTATNAYVHQLFFDGLGVNLAKTTVYALLWKRSQKIWSLPLTRHALQGFATQDPDAVRDPATWPLVLLMAERMAKHFENGALLAAFILLAFDAYARVGELLRSSASWLIPPSTSGSHSKRALIFFPSDQNMKSKTKQQDDTVIVGDLHERAWLNSIAGAVWRRAFPHRRLFPLVYADVLKACKKAFAEVGCSGEVMCPHRLRHGGASVDALQGKPSTYIKHRGRWTSSKSVSRYMKHGRYLRMMSLLSDQQRNSSRKAEQWLKKHFIKLLK